MRAAADFRSSKPSSANSQILSPRAARLSLRAATLSKTKARWSIVQTPAAGSGGALD
jgi:hypothetical protein